MSFESALIWVVLIALVAAVAAKQWERQARRQYEAELNIGKRRIFGRRKRKTKNNGN